MDDDKTVNESIYMGAECPECGVEITTENAGGYRTYCDECVDDVVRKLRGDNND